MTAITPTIVTWNDIDYDIELDSNKKQITVTLGTLSGYIAVDPDGGVFTAHDSENGIVGIHPDFRDAFRDVCAYLVSEQKALQERTARAARSWNQAVSFLKTAEHRDIGDDVP
ncbi:MAG: hypothetical protein OXC29_12850 [Rhodococcus sp.]|nr:hypothetical protein [Rhodococcus sp. (in: high G+C Gram-positive bacteria)]